MIGGGGAEAVAVLRQSGVPWRDGASDAPHRGDEENQVVPSGVTVLDALLPRGGLSRGRLSEISGARSSGKRAIATAFCAAAIEAGDNAIWIDARGSSELGRFTPLSALEYGLPLQGLLAVQLRRETSDENGSLAKAAYRAADLILGVGPAAALVVIELPILSERSGTRQVGKLVRLQRAAESSGTALLFISERRGGGDSLGMSIALHLSVRRGVEGRRGVLDPWSTLRVTIEKSKLGKMAQAAEITLNEPHGVSLDSTV